MFKHNTQVVCTYANRENTLVGIVCRFSGAKMIRIQQTYPLSTQTFAYNFCHRIIVPNQFIYNTLLFNGISQDTINIIPELISKQSTKKKISSINLRKHFNIDAKTLVLGVVESLRYVNRHRDIIEAFTHIKKERSAFLKAKLLIIGSGPQKILIKELIAEKDMESDILLSDSITFTSSMYRELDCLIVPSLIESSGYNILAAYQANVPVIVSDAGCLKEYVEEEVTGLIFKKGDAIDLEKKIKTLIDRSDLRRKMSEYIPQYIEEYFSPYKLIQTYEKLFTSILK